MILIFSSDDMKLISNDYSEKYSEKIFGIPYCYVNKCDYKGFLGKNENLFISAHGNQNEIGSMSGSSSFTADELAKLLKKDVLPAQYKGAIFVSACHSAPKFVNALYKALGSTFKNRIYGVATDVDYVLQPPNNNVWILAI